MNYQILLLGTSDTSQGSLEGENSSSLDGSFESLDTLEVINTGPVTNSSKQEAAITREMSGKYRELLETLWTATSLPFLLEHKQMDTRKTQSHLSD